MPISSIIALIISAVSTVVQARKQRKAKKDAEAKADENAGFKITVKGEASPIPIVYGRQMVGGILADAVTRHDHIYAATPNADSEWLANSRFTVGTDLDYKARKHRNRFLIAQYAIAQGEIEEVRYVQVDDLPYNDKEFIKEEGGHIIVAYNNGGTACPLATANTLKSTNKFTDLAFCTTSFWLDRDDPQYYQIPDLKFYVKGKKIPLVVDAGGGNYTYDRAGSLTYTNNPALVLLDYLTGEYGMGLANSQIDLGSFYNAATVCAQTVNPLAGLGAVERRGYVWKGNTRTHSLNPLYGATIGGEAILQIFQGKNTAYTELTSDIQSRLAANNYVGQIVHEDGGHYDIDFTNSTYNATDNTIDVPLADVTEVDGAPVMDTAADIEEIQLSAMIDKINSSEDTLPLYECNITLDPSKPVRENIQDILNSMPNADFIWSEGKFKLRLDYWQDQASLKTQAENTFILTDGLLANTSITTTYPNADIKLNSASVRYSDEQEDFKDKTQTWPEKNSAVHTTYLSEDNGVVLNAQLDGSGISDPYHARALAEQTVRESRRGILYEFECFPEAYALEPGDVIKLNSVINGLTADDDIIKVNKVELTENLNVKVTGTKISATDFAWNISDEIVSPYDRHISYEVLPPVLTNSEISLANVDNPTSYGYRVLPQESSVFLRFETSNSNAFDYYEIEWAKSNSADDDDWFIAGRTKNEQFTMVIGEPEEDVYIRARSISQTGKKSVPSEVVIGPVNVVTATASAWNFQWDIQNISWVEQGGGGYTSPDATAKLEAFIGAQEMTRIAYTGDTNDLDDFEWWVSNVSNTGTFTRSDTAYTLGQNYFETTTSSFSASGIISVTLQLKLPGYDVFTTVRKLAVTGVEIGTNGANVNIIFQRSVGVPSTPTPSTGIPAGWSDTSSGTTGTDTLWASQGTTPVDSDTYTWDTPFQIEGNATAEIYIYRKNSSAGNTGGSYNFLTSTLTPPAGWSVSPPSLTSDGDIVYSAVALFVGSNVETAATATWSTPVVYSQRTDGVDGANGVNGADGDNGANVNIIFQRSASAPSTPTPSTGIPSGWADTPAGTTGTELLWASKGVTPINSTTYTWGAPYQVEGTAVAESYAFRLNNNTGNTGGSYNFTTGTLTPPAGWSNSPPALASDGDIVYVIAALFSGSPTETAATATWSTPTIYAQRTDGTNGTNGADGADGADGDAGLKTKTGFVYYQLTGDPGANPSASSYTFSTGAFSGLTANWSTTPPAISGDSYYASKYEVTESASGSNTGTPSFSTRFQNFNFTSLVSFTDLSTSGSTTIHGDNVTTGTIESTDYSYTSGNFSDSGTAIYLNGNGVIRSQNFNVDSSGNLRLKGSVICSSAAISGWTFEANGMYIGTAQDAYEFNGQGGISMGNNSTYGAYITHPNFYVMTALSGNSSYPQVGIKGGTMHQSGGSITGSGIWLRKRDILATSGTDAAYDFAVGDKSGDYLEWKGKEGTLTVGGDIIATGNIQTGAVEKENIGVREVTAGNAASGSGFSISNTTAYTNQITVSVSNIESGDLIIAFYYLIGQMDLETGSTDNIRVRLRETSGSVKYNGTFKPAIGARSMSGFRSWNAAVSGTVTYYLDASLLTGFGNTWDAEEASLAIIHLKR
jgi:hypothetical protein